MGRRGIAPRRRRSSRSTRNSGTCSSIDGRELGGENTEWDVVSPESARCPHNDRILTVGVDRLVEHFSPGCTSCTSYETKEDELIVYTEQADIAELSLRHMRSSQRKTRTWRRVEGCSLDRSTVRSREVSSVGTFERTGRL